MLTKPALLRFKFDGFADLPTEVDCEVESEVQTDCNGNKWELHLFPGDNSSTNEQGWIALYLYAKEIKESLDTVFSISVKDSKGKVVKNEEDDHLFEREDYGQGYYQFIKRSEILDTNKNILRNGALCIDVTIQLNQNDQNTDTVVQGILPEVFRHVLRFVYTGFCPEYDEVLDFGKELIDAANKYELAELKLDVENVLVSERIMNKQNVSDWILFADAQCCPLLKEYAISYFLLDPTEILKSEHSKCLQESGEVLSEIMMLMADGDNGMTVTELRKELGKRDLEVDGSKETLAARLESAKRQKTE